MLIVRNNINKIQLPITGSWSPGPAGAINFLLNWQPAPSPTAKPLAATNTREVTISNMTKKLLFTLFTLTIWSTVISQTVFEKSYEVEINNKFSYISQLALLSDSSYIFSTTAYDNSDNFLLIGKIDYFGNILWVKQVNDSFQISQANFAISGSNEIYLAYSAINGNPFRNYSVVVKMDLSGNLIWSKSYGDSTRNQYCEHIFFTPTSIYLAGETSSSSPYDLYVIKLDTAGNYNWGLTYDAGGIDYLRDAKQLSNGNILLSGLTRDSLNHHFNSIFRIDTNGAIVWNKRYHLPSFKEFNSQAINEDYDGNLFLTGYADTVEVSSSTYFGKWDISVMKITASGNFLWAKIYGGPDFDEVWQVLPTDDHGLIFAVEPESFGNVSRIGLMKCDSVGNIDWMRLYGKVTGGFPNNIVINYDKGYTIFATDGDYNVNAPMVFIRTDSLGVSICPDSVVTLPQMSFNPTVDTLGGFGTLSGIAPFAPMIVNYSLLVNDYCDPNFIQNLTTDYFCQVYPNPFTTSVSLSIHKQNLREVTVDIQNILGQTVYEIDEMNLINTFSKTIDMSELSSGIYFLSTTIDGQKTTRKIVKQ